LSLRQRLLTASVLFLVLLTLSPYITSAQTPFLAFPLRNRTPDTAVINTAFDHSMALQYCPDNSVVSYTGEVGRREFGASSFSVYFGCDVLQGFRNSLGSIFILNGHYSGAEYLFYDGHPGYDYKTTDQDPTGKIEVLAATSGTIICVSLRIIPDGADMNREENAGACTEGPTQGEIKVDHGNGYFSIYLHLSSADVHAGDTVASGQKIGLSGETGARGAPHLHFEVRKNINGVLIPVDPYGWLGSGPDPYRRATNVNLWSTAGTFRPCHMITSSTPLSSIPQGFGVPWNVSNPSELIIQAFCSASSVSITLGNQNPLQYIYNAGYLYKQGSTNWTPINYTSTEALISGAWYPKTANTIIPMTSAELANPSYVLGYVCTWTGTQWKCGCRDDACAQSYWQVQGIQQMSGNHAVNMFQGIGADVLPPPPPLP
jgi:murein DD-endopeptidase MepM/ murein hydrolase activator NlpD